MRCLSLLFATILLAAPVMADEVVVGKDSATLSLPSCDDAKLNSLLSRKYTEYYQKHPAISQLEKRMQKLLTRHMKQFSELDIKEFSSDENIYVTNKIMEVKINNGLEDEQLRLCRTPKTVNLPDIYLLIYPHSYYYMVEIINFTGLSSSKEFFVIYD